MRRAKSQITQFLHVCDRVEILSEIVHDADRALDVEKFDALMTPYYPCLDQFFRDIRGEKDVTGIDVDIEASSASFTVRTSSGEKTFTYTNIETVEE